MNYAAVSLLLDKDSDVDDWNRHISQYFAGVTWFSGTWLFNECYLYRRLREIYIMSHFWKSYDPFGEQKLATFRGSHGSVFDLARKMPEMIQPMSDERKELVYQELLQVCLWGNATDLSLLTNMTEEDIKRLQAVEKEKLAEQKKHILVDNIDEIWEKLKTLKDGRVDFVLDNSGTSLSISSTLLFSYLFAKRFRGLCGLDIGRLVNTIWQSFQDRIQLQDHSLVRL